jgi:CheY-like chemotaxis protein
LSVSERQPMPQLPELKDRRLLIVDDDPEDRRVVGELAELHGCIVRRAASLQEMDAISREWAPELLILDIVMPAPDGISILRQLSEAHCRTPVLLISAHSELLKPVHNLGRVYGTRVVGELVKPIDAVGFVNALRAAFASVAAPAAQ